MIWANIVFNDNVLNIYVLVGPTSGAKGVGQGPRPRPFQSSKVRTLLSCLVEGKTIGWTKIGENKIEMKDVDWREIKNRWEEIKSRVKVGEK